MRQVSLITPFLFLVWSVSAQQEKRNLEAFTRLDVFGPFDVELIPAETESIELNYRGVSRDNLVADVVKGELRLKLRNKEYFQDWNRDYPVSDYVKVKVYYVVLQDIQVQAGAKIENSQTLKSRNLMLNCTMGAEARLTLLTKNLFCRSAMGALVNLDGQTDHLEITSKMGAVHHSTHLQSKTAYVRATMGAEVDLAVSDEIEISAGMGAVIDYVGGPTVRHSSRGLGAEINGRNN
jgi:hypothetical protein